VEAESSPLQRNLTLKFKLHYPLNSASPASARGNPINFMKAQGKADPFHARYKVPAGDTPYSKAKHLQRIEGHGPGDEAAEPAIGSHRGH